MAYKKEPYLTKEDRERIARIEHDPNNDYLKFKYMITLTKPRLNQEVCIKVYGCSEEDVRKNINEHLQIFKNNDKKWKISRTQNLKSDVEI